MISRILRQHTPLAVVTLVMLSGVAQASPDALKAAFDTPDYPTKRAELLQSSDLDGPTLNQLATHSDWRVASTASALLRWQADPAAAQAVWELHPLVTRIHTYRFVDVIDDSAPIVLERLFHGGESSTLRYALVDLVWRSGDDWGALVAASLTDEEDELVRAGLAGILRHADARDAHSGLTVALSDPSPMVREAAAAATGWHDHGGQLSHLLIPLIDDSSPAVRGMAARSLGWHGSADSFDAIGNLLSDTDPEVRLYALRALESIDATRLRAHPLLTALSRDPDARVARAANGMK